MRISILALVIAGNLAQAGVAAAQPGMMMGQPQVEAHDQFTGPTPPMPTRHDRYLMQLQTLRDKTLRTKAKDGGQLSPEHAASLQHELDELNRRFGIQAG